jgi:hypothetical protein
MRENLAAEAGEKAEEDSKSRNKGILVDRKFSLQEK